MSDDILAAMREVLQKTHSTLRLINLWIAKHSTDKIWQQYQEEINPTPVEEEIIALLSTPTAGERKNEIKYPQGLPKDVYAKEELK